MARSGGPDASCEVLGTTGVSMAGGRAEAQRADGRHRKERGPVTEPLTRLDASTVQLMFGRAHSRIVEHRDEINALNVFPIPDGDTGTNMALTLEQAAKAAHAAAPGDAVGPLLMAVSRATILGARGNSGVILAQYLRGFARHVAGLGDDPDGEALARGLEAAAQSAYGAVDTPVEGTILTVARAAGFGARSAADAGGDIATVLRAAAESARLAVGETTALLPELARAGVVDSAGLGLAHMLEAMAEALEGRHTAGATTTALLSAAVAEPGMEALFGTEAAYGFEVQFVLEGSDISLPGLRTALHPLGESLVVGGDDRLAKVHIHTRETARVLDVAQKFGIPQSVTIENLDAQVAARHGHPLVEREA